MDLFKKDYKERVRQKDKDQKKERKPRGIRNGQVEIPLNTICDEFRGGGPREALREDGISKVKKISESRLKQASTVKGRTRSDAMGEAGS